jgi:TRAP-type transport system small permease protein
MTAPREAGAAAADRDGGRSPDARRSAARSARALPEGPVERLCSLACMAALIVMLGVIGLDILTRALLNFSFEISDDLGGYMLVVIAFVSLPVCQVNDSFHHVEFVQSRLSPRGRAVSHVIFDLLSLAFCAALVWQLGRLEITSWRFGDQAPTYLATPLWIPRLAMVVGAAALVFTMVRTLAADIAQLLNSGKDPLPRLRGRVGEREVRSPHES